MEQMCGLAGFVDSDAEVREPELLIEGLHDREALPVDRQRDHLEIRSAELGLKPIERRHLLPARDTPCRPDIEENDATSKIRECHRAPVAINEQKGWHG